METALRTSAAPAQGLSAPFALRDVEDLHDADLDGVLTDALIDADVAVAAADAVADLVRRPGQDAALAHSLGARALFLALG